MIREGLQRMGLSAGESEIYELLTQVGETKAGSLIRQANLTSSKVYDVLQKLIHKGLVSFVEKQGIKYYQALPPEHLLEFLEQKKRDIASVQEDVTKLIPLLKKKQKPIQSNVRMYVGKEGPKIVLRELIDASMDAKINYGYGTQDNPFIQLYPDEMQQFFDAEEKHDFETLLLFANTHKQKQPKAKIKYLPPEFITPVRTMIAGDKVFMVDFTDKITSIIIENPSIARSYIDHFKFLWKLANKT